MSNKRASELSRQLRAIETLVAQGITPKKAMAATFGDDDWLLAYAGFKLMVGRVGKSSPQHPERNGSAN